MKKYLTLYTLLLIFLATISVAALNETCKTIYGDFGITLPLLTEYMRIILEKRFYYLFSALTATVIMILPFTRFGNKRGGIEQLVIGLHLIFVSMFLFSFTLPFSTMCETIE